MKNKLFIRKVERFPLSDLTRILVYSFSLFILVSFSGCGEDEDNDPQGINARLQGTWGMSDPKIQYLGENGTVLHEEPDGAGMEIGFNNNIATVIEEDGFAYSVAYTITQASGKDFINFVDADETYELAFPASNQMVWTRVYLISTSQGVGWYDENADFHPASSARYYWPFTKR